MVVVRPVVASTDKATVDVLWQTLDWRGTARTPRVSPEPRNWASAHVGPEEKGVVGVPTKWGFVADSGWSSASSWTPLMMSLRRAPVVEGMKMPLTASSVALLDHDNDDTRPNPDCV